MSDVSSIEDEVFLSLLALDAYNRGYNAGIELDPTATGLGRAAFFSLLGEDAVENLEPGSDGDARAASFYARAYSYNGEIIIAYRGTDQEWWDDSTWGYVVNGWGLGGGVLAVPQAVLALDF